MCRRLGRALHDCGMADSQVCAVFPVCLLTLLAAIVYVSEPPADLSRVPARGEVKLDRLAAQKAYILDFGTLLVSRPNLSSEDRIDVGSKCDTAKEID